MNFCDDPDINVFDLKEPLQSLIPPPVDCPSTPENPQNPPVISIPRGITESEKEGVLYLCGFTAQKMKKVDPSLGGYIHNPVPGQMTSKFLDLYSRGGLTYPKESFYDDFQSIMQDFNLHHPKNGLRTTRVVSSFFELLKNKYSHYDPKVLHLISRLLTRMRIRTMNQNYRTKRFKKCKTKGARTLRGRNKLSQLTAD